MVCKDKQSQSQLVAYCVLNEKSNRSVSTAVREHLKIYLPDYMIPTHFMWLDVMPLTASGKINRTALPSPEIGFSNGYTIGPRNALEAELNLLFQSVLEISTDNIFANFF